MKLIIINGLPGAGKTLFTEFCKEALLKVNPDIRILTTSTVSEIKDIALHIGWNGIKDDKGRRLLSDLKLALDRYCDNTHLLIDTLTTLDYDYIFLDAREPEDISYAKEVYNAITVYIKRKNNAKEYYSNMADTAAKNYKDKDYDYIIDNDNDSFSIFYVKACDFINNI